MQIKKTWKQVDGVVLLDKPLGLTSNDALQKVRRIFSAAKGGHTGTLDPLATGLLPICFGEATKFSADLLDADKTYLATIRFGITTDTGDAEGQVTATRPVCFSESDLIATLPKFTGELLQMPPMHSALKRDGRPLYELARQGLTVDREARQITVSHLELLEMGCDHAVVRVRCSKGTYVRTVAADLGESLGCGAHLIALRRTEVGDLTLEGAYTLDSLSDMQETRRAECLLPVDRLLRSLPVVELTADQEERFIHGNPIAPPSEVNGPYRVYARGKLLGVGNVEKKAGGDSKLWPKRLVQLL